MEKNFIKSIFLYGTQFYRPPNPPGDQRKQDLENIKKLGFNIIKIFAEWNWVNQYEDKYDFRELIEIILEAKKLDITVDINTRIEQSPYWVAEKYPDSYYMDIWDRKVQLHARSNTPTGGWPGLCLDHPGVKKEAEKFLKQCALTLGKYENVKIFDCWNEPHIEPADPSESTNVKDLLFCYCPHTIKAYHKWLKEKYKTIDNINNKWFKKYRDFKDIKPPRKLIDYVEMMEWRKFMTWSMAEKMNWRYKVIKENLSRDKYVMSHSVLHGITEGFSIYGDDDYQLTENLDLFGLSLFPLWANSDAFDVCLDIEATTSMTRNKTCINTELQGGQAISAPTGFSRSKIPQRNHLRMWNFIDIACGIKGIMYWQYRNEMLGHEAPGFGLVRRDGSFTERSDEASRICNFLNKYPNLFNCIKPQDSEIAIIVNRDSYYLNFAAEGDEKYCINSIRGFHRFLLRNNIKSDLLIEEMLEDKISNYKLLFLSLPLVMNKNIADILSDYVRDGGIIVSDCAVGIFNKFGIAQEIVPSHGLSKMFGVKQDELRQFDFKNRENIIAEFWSGHHKITGEPDIYFKGKGEFKLQKVKMNAFLENYILDSAKEVFEHEGKIVGTVNNFGKGKSYLLGTLVGQSLLLGDSDTEKMLLKLFDLEGIKYNFKNNLIIRDLSCNSNKLKVVVIVNPNKEKIKQKICFDKNVEIIDFYDNKIFKYKVLANELNFEIESEDASCLIYQYK